MGDRIGGVEIVMVQKPMRTLDDLVKHLDRYPEEAFLFVREGLSHAVEKLHGPETQAHQILQEFLAERKMDWDDLIAQYHTGQLPAPLVHAVDSAGGTDKLNRHVSGRELCWGLRDFALCRWGMLSRTVLQSWNISGTADFGRIVFGFIDMDMMLKESSDTLDDFVDIYDFEEAFDETYRSGLFGDDDQP